MKVRAIDVLYLHAIEEDYDGREDMLILAASDDRHVLDKLKRRFEKAARKAMREVPALKKRLDGARPSDADLANLGFEEDEYPIARLFHGFYANRIAIDFKLQSVPVTWSKNTPGA